MTTVVPSEKQCPTCEHILPASEFYQRSRSCKFCTRAERKAYRQEHRERLLTARREQYRQNPEKFRREKRESAARNRDATNQRQREWWAAAGSEQAAAKRVANPGKYRDMHLRSRYGITLEQYESMVTKQGGCCAICHEPFEPLYVDHCHDTGQVRGLLCNTCNAGLGYLRDDPLLAHRAVYYLLGEVSADGLATGE